MKSEKGLLHLLLVGEIAILIFVLVLGIGKWMRGKDEPAEEISYSQEDPEDLSAYFETPGIQGEESAEADNTEGSDGMEGARTESEEEQDASTPQEVVALLSEMTMEQKVAQLFIVSPETLTGNDRVTIAGAGTRTALQNYPVGGMVYSSVNYMGNEQMRDLISRAQNMSMEQNGQYLFAGIIQETESGAILIASHVGQEQPLGSLLASDAVIDAETTAEYIQLPICQSMEQLSGEQGGDQIVCYQVSQGAEEAVEAMQNGADLICVTEGFQDVYQAVLAAVQEQEISQDALDRAVGRILMEKQTISQQDTMGNEE